MKPNEFIRKYNLTSERLNIEGRQNFVKDMEQEFLHTLDFISNGELTTSHFYNAVKQIKQKWDSISNKARYPLSEGYWKYFYATVIVRIKKEYGFEQQEREEKEKEQKQKERNQFRFNNPYSFFFDEFEFILEQMFRQFNYQYHSESTHSSAARVAHRYSVREAAQILELEVPFTEEELKKAWRKKAIETHPDKGGSSEKFNIVVTAKDICMQHLKLN